MANIVQIKNLSFGYDYPLITLNAINFTLNRDEMVYLSGESGCGKSTLLKLLNRLLEPDTGALFYDGKQYADIEPMELRKKIQFVSQTPFLFPISVLENFKVSSPECTEEEVEELMRGFNLPLDLLQSGGNRLSVGQAARISVIRSLLLRPEVILLDEPTAALDPRNTDIFFRLYDELRKKLKFATIWVTHEPERAKGMAGRHLLIKDGGLYE
ncbi:MAG: ATP-binding cassette domain-containing protein [Nitrospinota bacterium]